VAPLATGSLLTDVHGRKGCCRGDGFSDTSHGKVRWAQGDLFVVPGSEDITHHASKESTEHGGAAFYWITDEPLCKYLGVTPTQNRFEPAHFTRDVSMLQPKQSCSLKHLELCSKPYALWLRWNFRHSKLIWRDILIG